MYHYQVNPFWGPVITQTAQERMQKENAGDIYRNIRNHGKCQVKLDSVGESAPFPNIL